jgi:hypothetical protein
MLLHLFTHSKRRWQFLLWRAITKTNTTYKVQNLHRLLSGNPDRGNLMNRLSLRVILAVANSIFMQKNIRPVNS